VVLSVSWAEISRIIQKQAYEMGLFQTVRDSWYSAYFTDSVGVCIPETVEGRKGVDVVNSKGPRFFEFAEKYWKMAGGEKESISFHGPIAYDAMWITALAIHLANSTNPGAIKSVLPTAFKIYR